jgi:acyl dehydratase
MNQAAAAQRNVGGPYFDDLSIGRTFTGAPGVTLTEGLAAAHQAILGDRLLLPLDRPLSARVTGGRAVAHPGLVWDVAIGQSTLATQRVVANLFYRGLAFHRVPAIGDTLRTTTEVTGLRATAAKADRPPRGLAVLRIATVDQDGSPVLDFHRCALLPARKQGETSDAELGPKAAEFDAGLARSAIAGWDLAAFRAGAEGPHFAALRPGAIYRVESGDVVSSAPELARLTLNLAAVHHDATRAEGSRRLVYGGHTIGIAAAQMARALPGLVTIVAWHSCDHTGPVDEGDTLHSEVHVERCDPLAEGSGGGFCHLHALVRATKGSGEVADVLDWRLVGLFA